MISIPTAIISAMIIKMIAALATNPQISKLPTKTNHASLTTAIAKPTKTLTVFLRTKQPRPPLS